MILPAPFGYEDEYVNVTTIAGEKQCVIARRIPIRRPHKPFFVDPEDIRESDVCFICGHGQYDEMHNPIAYTDKEY